MNSRHSNSHLLLVILNNLLLLLLFFIVIALLVGWLGMILGLVVVLVCWVVAAVGLHGHCALRTSHSAHVLPLSFWWPNSPRFGRLGPRRIGRLNSDLILGADWVQEVGVAAEALTSNSVGDHLLGFVLLIPLISVVDTLCWLQSLQDGLVIVDYFGQLSDSVRAV